MKLLDSQDVTLVGNFDYAWSTPVDDVCCCPVGLGKGRELPVLDTNVYTEYYTPSLWGSGMLHKPCTPTWQLLPCIHHYHQHACRQHRLDTVHIFQCLRAIIQLSSDVHTRPASAKCCQPAGLAAYSDSELPGPNLPLPCGYSAVAEKLAQDLDITFGWRLARLEWGSTGGRTSGDGGRSGVVLRSSCGQCIQADAVILTLPLGVLKVHPQP